jgi:hypothetical protein
MGRPKALKKKDIVPSVEKISLENKVGAFIFSHYRIETFIYVCRYNLEQITQIV